MGISAKQFEAMQNRLGKPRSVAEAVEVKPPGGWAKGAVVLGVDPSLRGTGFGVVRASRQGQSLVAQGTIQCPTSWPRSRCLATIAGTLREVIREHRPEVCAMEGLFYAQNLKTALIMGEARGAAMAAVAEAGLRIHEIAPRKLKQAMVGYGAAQKTAVARMVQRLLTLEEVPEPDAADALALALVHGQELGRPILHPSKEL